MANSHNRAIIACSVSALALAIVSLYYWKLRKKRISSVPNDQINQIVDINNIEDISNVSKPIHCEQNNFVTYNENISAASLINQLDIEQVNIPTSSIKSSVILDTESNEHTFEKEDSIVDSVHSCHKEGASEAIHSDITTNFDDSLTSTDISSDKSPNQIELESNEMHLNNNENVSSNLSSVTTTNSLIIEDSADCIFEKKEHSLCETTDIHFEKSITEDNTNLVDSVISKTDSDADIVDFVESELDKCQTDIDNSSDESKLLESCNGDNITIIANETSTDSHIATNGNDNDDSSADGDINKRAHYHLQSSSPVQQPPAPSNDDNYLLDNSDCISVKLSHPTFAQVLSSSKDSFKQTDNPSNNTATKESAMAQQIHHTDFNNAIPLSCDNANHSMAQAKDEIDFNSDFVADKNQFPLIGEEQNFNECGDDRSQGSNDSGKGGSDILHVSSANSPESPTSNAYHIVNVPEDQVICFQFEMPHNLCGKLIGVSGHFINGVKQETNTQIVVNSHYFNPNLKICSITGTKLNVTNALGRIRRRFPIKDYPNVTLRQINLISPIPTIPLSQACQLHLPSEIVTDVILSCTISAGHFFLQQPTHPSYPKLHQLDFSMTDNYSQSNAPPMPHVQPGIICAAPTAEGWFRALINNVHETNKECDIMFVDYGGYAYNVPVNSLRQIRYDFMSLPFQASECYLSNVLPADDEIDWTQEANVFFEELAKGQIIYAVIQGYDEVGIPLVNLFKHHGDSHIFINKELVEKGHAQWIDSVSLGSS